MKKATLIMTISVFMFTGAQAQTITVNSPNGGETLVAGTIHKISWTTAGISGDVNILLYHNTTRIGKISTASLAAATSFYDWTVSNPLSDGSGYTFGGGFKVVVKHVGSQVYGASDGPFSIIAPDNLPDLVVRDMTVTPRGQTHAGLSKPMCEARIVNIGTGPSAATTARLRISVRRGTVIYSNLGQWVPVLQPGQESRFSQLPELPQPGRYIYNLMADGDKSVAESNENNNSDSKTYIYNTCQLPDLVVELGIDKEFRFGVLTKSHVTAKIKNIGQSTSSTCHLMIWVDGSYLTILEILPIDAGKFRQKRLMQLPLFSTGKNKEIIVEIDRHKVVSECDEDNNITKRSYNF